MKFIGKLLISLLLLTLLALVALYIALQTEWGANGISRWVSQHTEYRLSLKKVSHSWTSPSIFQLDEVSFGHENQPPTLVAKQVSLGLSVRQITTPSHLASLQLEGGTLNLSQTGYALPLQADVLQLKDMALQAQDGDWRLNGQQVNGGITPWEPQPGNLLGNNARFQLSARSLTLNDIPASQVLVEGTFENRRLTLSNFGANVARGELTGSAQRADDGGWQINRLRLSNVRLQTTRSLSDFWRPVAALPAVSVDRFDLIDARIEGPGWAASDLDATLQHVTFQQGNWQSEDGSLSFNATDLINGDIHLIDPIIHLDLSPQGIAIRQFSTRWERGLLRASGNWLRSDHRLTLDELVIAGVEYTLPGDWRQRWQQTLPSWLEEISVKKFTANRNLLIDINPDFPFQVTALDGYGSDLLLARQHQWGIWQGSLNLNASDATFNKVDIRRPSLALTADNDRITFTDLSAFTQGGLLEAKASIDQTPAREFTLDMNGKSTSFDTLLHWGWPTPTRMPSGNLNFQLRLNGKMANATPLKPTLNGILQGTDSAGQPLQQRLHQGVLQERMPTP
ncbi:AsmA family protein [Lonsdalea quercina]|uniref:AsmA family protein n=1 Tax=Lonsdalea quercina TaxID=71657 RepID=UPI0039759D12